MTESGAPSGWPPPGQPGPGQPGPGQPGPGQPPYQYRPPLPQYGPPQYGPPQYGPPQYGPPQYPPSPGPASAESRGRTGYVRALGAAAVWAAVNLVLALALAGSSLTAEGAGYLVGVMVIPVLLAALITWLIARRRSMPFWALVLVAAPSFWLLRLVLGAIRATGRG